MKWVSMPLPWRDGISLREPVPSAGKTALRFDPFGLVAAVRVHPTSLRSTIGSRVDRKSDVTFDQTAAKRHAPRRFS
jgi:hypothetical protein